jgi:DNA-binding transcriptional ArsR family regulator
VRPADGLVGGALGLALRLEVGGLLGGLLLEGDVAGLGLGRRHDHTLAQDAAVSTANPGRRSAPPVDDGEGQRPHAELGEQQQRRYHRHVTMNGAGAPVLQVDEPAAMSAAACMFRSLGDPTRLAILRHLTAGEHKVVDLTAHLGLAQSTVSAHLACLRDCGLVASRPQGRASMWSLEHSAELMGLLAAAERLLDATGDVVVLCPAFGEAALR